MFLQILIGTYKNIFGKISRKPFIPPFFQIDGNVSVQMLQCICRSKNSSKPIVWNEMSAELALAKQPMENGSR